MAKKQAMMLLAGTELAEAIEWRHHLHSRPELAFQEMATSEFVAAKLRSFGLEVVTGIAKTGVVATLRGALDQGRALALRCDLDALPLAEDNDFAHRSIRPKVMHACGHDGHTAMLLAAARLLSRNRQAVGLVHFIFQPAEEAEGGGAAMIEDGLFERFPVQAIFGLHNWPGLPVGQFAIRPGAMMAAFDVFELEIMGRGCHGAMPHLGVDPVQLGAEFVMAAQTIVSRKLTPVEPAVVSITQFHAGDAWAVIPERAELRGTARSFTAKTSELIEQHLKQLAEGLAVAHGAQLSLRYERRYPATVNSPVETELCAKVARSVVGAENVRTDLAPSMGAEDFAFMLQRVPGAYIWLGNGPTSGGCQLHNPRYDFNDEALAVGAEYWVQLAEQWFQRA